MADAPRTDGRGPQRPLRRRVPLWLRAWTGRSSRRTGAARSCRSAGHSDDRPGAAAIVQRIFHEFGLLGQSPLAISRRLNAEGVPPPSAHYHRDAAAPDAVEPVDAARRLHEAERDPPQHAVHRRADVEQARSTGRTRRRAVASGSCARRPRSSPRACPHLRIVDDVVWHAAQARLAAMRTASRVGALAGTGTTAAAPALRAGEVRDVRRVVRDHDDGSMLALPQPRGDPDVPEPRALRREELESRVLTALKGPLVADGGPFDAFCADRRGGAGAAVHDARRGARGRHARTGRGVRGNSASGPRHCQGRRRARDGRGDAGVADSARRRSWRELADQQPAGKFAAARCGRVARRLHGGRRAP